MNLQVEFRALGSCLLDPNGRNGTVNELLLSLQGLGIKPWTLNPRP